MPSHNVVLQEALAALSAFTGELRRQSGLVVGDAPRPAALGYNAVEGDVQLALLLHVPDVPRGSDSA